MFFMEKNIAVDKSCGSGGWQDEEKDLWTIFYIW